jgi:hypothetical protein
VVTLSLGLAILDLYYKSGQVWCVDGLINKRRLNQPCLAGAGAELH